MGLNEIFNETISLLEKTLDLRSLKHNLIVSNIANKDTPNYKSFDLVVEEEIKKIIGSEERLKIANTQGGHLSITETGVNKSEVKLIPTSKGFLQGGDANTVNIEAEMTSLAENNLLYDAMAQIIRKKFQGLKVAIQGGGK